jgi:HPt (histidine-containing phosphotransfer) domain-containing protein
MSNDPWMIGLRARYARELPARLEQIRQCAEALRTDASAQESRRNLELELHRLGGSAGSHGFPSVSRVAQDWEHALLTDPGALDGDWTRRLVDATAADLAAMGSVVDDPEANG